MPVVALFGLSIVMSFIASGIAAWLFLWPWLRDMPRDDALLRLLVPHTFRFLGLSFLVPGVVSPTLSRAFAAPAAYGDLIAAVLAVAALLGLRARAIWALPLIWLFNLWGTADLLNAYYQGALGAPVNPGALGAAFFIPTVLVPPLLIIHGLIFRFLLRPAAH
jgi:hypothetical protein